jgi:hypothetical protein
MGKSSSFISRGFVLVSEQNAAVAACGETFNVNMIGNSLTRVMQHFAACIGLYQLSFYDRFATAAGHE